jgi:hypothetical protein
MTKSITYADCVEVAEKFNVNIQRTGKKIELWFKSDHSVVTECKSVAEAWATLHSDFHPKNRQSDKDKLEKAIDLIVETKIAEMRESNQKLVKQHMWLFDNIDGLLTFTKHERNSCSDENPINGSDTPSYVRCTRCQFLRIKKDGFNVGWTFFPNIRYQELEEIPSVNQVKELLQKL